MRWAILCVLALLALAFQDPDRGPTSRPLPPIQEPFRTKVERQDLLQEFTEPSPLEGVYRLRSVNGGASGVVPAGYLHVGRTHLSLQTAVFPNREKEPYLQASVRTYRIDGDKLVMTTALGHEYAGDIAMEKQGRVEVRRFQRAGPVLKVFRADGSFMEFVRVE